MGSLTHVQRDVKQLPAPPAMAHIIPQYFASVADWRWAFALALAFVPYQWYCLRRKTPPLPPGPRGLPFVGNVLDIPSENHWIKFTELGAIWGARVPLGVHR